MLVLNIRGVRVEAEFSFLIFLAAVFMFREGETILLFTAVSVIHELGHALALYAVGGEIGTLSLWGMGIRMIPKGGGLLSFTEEAFILSAGPLVNILFSLASWGSLFGYISLAAAVYNLLPYSMLDGGGLLDLIAESSQSPLAKGAVTAVRLMTAAGLLYASVTVSRDYFLLFCISAVCCIRDI